MMNVWVFGFRRACSIRYGGTWVQARLKASSTISRMLGEIVEPHKLEQRGLRVVNQKEKEVNQMTREKVIAAWAAGESMRPPSPDELARLGCDGEATKRIGALCEAVDDPKLLEQLVAGVPATERYVRSLHSCPYRSGIWRRTVVMHAADTLLEGFGVEPIYRTHVEFPFGEYVNQGDIYQPTLVYLRGEDEFGVMSQEELMLECENV